MSDATRILQAIEQGDPHAAGQLLPLVYEELRKLAAVRSASDSSGIASTHTVSAESRTSARRLRDLAGQIADCHQAGHWLRLILNVLDDEPIPVIEPTSRRLAG